MSPPQDVGDQALLGQAGAGGGSNIDDTDLKCYWRFNEASGDIINQSESSEDLGSSADLQITGATYETGSPPLGNALYFADLDKGVAGSSLSDWDFMHSTDATWTIAFWYRCVSFAGNEMAFFNTSQINNARGFCVKTVTFKTGLTLTQFNGASSSSQYTACPTTDDYIPDTTSWHFYVVMRDQASDTTTFRRDDANEETPTNEISGISPTNGNCAMAHHVCRKAGYTEMWNDGYFSETSIWDKIMSAEDQTTLYNGGSGLAIY